MFMMVCLCKDNPKRHKGKTNILFSFAFLGEMKYLCKHHIESIMSSKLSAFGGILSHYKYLITVVVGVAIVGFLDSDSYLQRVKYELQINQLKDEIKKYNEQNEKTTKELHTIRDNPRAIEKIARERYLMKADDEDIFVLSTDLQAGEDEDGNSTH